ncbi:hydroxymethylbilane synthase [Anthocerotibacter panamensis]|uniref:hydroxymethylbilane synthase n=1 Tax=Anthocerotibacter panamensis TaxID=2857077 RepID=UPI001C403F34|nr:hydroxymethylbilane synthase [Anthocerotibacter panamensis]
MLTEIKLPTLRQFRLGSRDSQLAMVQSEWVKAQLEQTYPGLTFAIDAIKTQGDKILEVPLAKIGDKGLFTKELETAMLEGRSDFAVHSLKDLPTRLPEGLVLTAITTRENPADALVLHHRHQGLTLDQLPGGAVIGTSSLRRLAQLRYVYPHLVFKDVRGNLNTRLHKLDEGQYDALILAVAGLERLGWGHRVSQVIPAEVSLHAVGQGALGIECREDDTELIALLQALNHRPTALTCRAERAFLRALEGGCQVPIGVSSHLSEDGQILLEGMVAKLDGTLLIRDQHMGLEEDPEAVGRALAEKLKAQGAEEILQEIFLSQRS